MPVKRVINKGRVPVLVYTDELESSAFEQLVNVSQFPFVFNHLAPMPDVHNGIGAIDEIPAAYKDIDQVMENQSDLVEVVHTLKQLVCIKG